MARLTPTVNSTLYSGIDGDRRRKTVKLTIAGTYNSASAADGGALLRPSDVGLQVIDSVQINPSFTADTIEEFPLSIGPSSSSTPGWVFALANKDDNLETADEATVTGVAFYADVYGY